MTELETKLSQILVEKQSKIIPENIKKDIQIFDITGTYEGNSGGVKLFETEEQMQQDPNANEGDLAVVYREEIQNMTVDTQTQYITFPETVTLLSAITESYHCMLRAADPSKMFDGNIMLDQNSFRFDGFTDTGMIRVMYQSDDGITYTRQEFMGDNGELTNPVDLGTEIHCEMQEEWNDNFGYFMQTGGNIFEGLYQCNEIEVENDVVKFVPLSSLTITVSDFNVNFSWDGTSIGNYDTTKIREMAQKILTELSKTGVTNFYYFIDNDDDLCAAFVKESYGQPSNLLLYKNDNTPYWGINTSSTNHVDVYKVNLEEMSYSLKTTLEQIGSLYSAAYYYIYDIKSKTLPVSISMRSNHHYVNIFWCCSTDSPGTSSGYDVGYYTPDGYESSHNELRYFIASTQLTATKDSVYNSTYYGKDGIEEGTLTKAPATTFNDVNAEVYHKLIQAYNNMEPVKVQNGQTFQDAYFISNSKGESLLDLSEVTNASLMFYGNNYISDYSNLNISNIENASNMFERALIDDISNFNFNSVSNAYYMFAYTKIKEIINLNLPNVTNADGMFRFCSDITSIDNINAPNISGSNTMFQGCSNLTSVNDLTLKGNCNSCFADCSNLITISNINTTEITNVIGMFENCISLKDCPALSISNVSDMQDMFSECTSLSNESLNNILQTCIDSAVQSSSYKTLKYIGLSEEQAQKCTTLSNWSALQAKGWTTDY